MSRLADLWKTADRGPATPLPTPGGLLTLDAVAKTAIPPEPAEDDDVPFIEVGGPRPIMKHLEPLAPKPAIKPPTPPPAVVVAVSPKPAESTAVMSVRFDAVHADQRSARGMTPEIVAFHHPDHLVSIQYRSLVAEMTAQLPGAKPRATLIMAAKSGIGATTVALNLAITLAKQDGMRVTIVDAHGEHPDLAAKLGLAATSGLRDILNRRNPAAWSVQETAQTNLSALTANRDDAPAIAAFGPIIEQLRSRNDWIIVDAGPWHQRLVPLAEACDAIYLVHVEDDAAAPEIIGAILNATGRLRGCIIAQKR